MTNLLGSGQHRGKSSAHWAVGLLCVLSLTSQAEEAVSAHTENPSTWVFTVDHESKKWTFKSIVAMEHSAVEKVFRKNLRNHERDEAGKLAQHLLDLVKKYKFDPAFVLSVIRAESHFDARAMSHVGARGLMQLMPKTAAYVAHRWHLPYKDVNCLYDPYKNLSLGVTYLAYLRDRYDRLDQFLAAYNAGPTVVDRLLKQNSFQPRSTKPYIEKIRSHVEPISQIRVARLVAPEITDVILGPEVDESKSHRVKGRPAVPGVERSSETVSQSDSKTKIGGRPGDIGSGLPGVPGV